MEQIETTKYEYIDSLRGFAILGVILVHSKQWIAPESNILLLFAMEGARGVQLFYITSALTLFLSMNSRKQERRTNFNFFIRRFFRIAPTFYAAIIIYTAYYGLSARYWAPNGIEWWYIPLTGLFLHGWHPETITSVVPGGWSIAVEMTFYLLIPYLFNRLKSINETLIALFCSLVLFKASSMIIFRFLTPLYPEEQQYLVDGFAFLSFFSQLPIFILGILLYHIIQKHPKSDKATALLLLTLSFFMFTGFLTSYVVPKHLLYGVAFILFALSLHYSPQKLFVNGATMLIGKLSFSIYLSHFMSIEILKKAFPNGFKLDGNGNFLLASLLVLILSICISYISYKLIETPGIKLGKSIIRKLQRNRIT